MDPINPNDETLQEIADLCEAVARLLRSPQSFPDSIAWRLFDAESLYRTWLRAHSDAALATLKGRSHR